MTVVAIGFGVVAFIEALVIVAGYAEWRTTHRALDSLGALLDQMAVEDKPGVDPTAEQTSWAGYGAHLPLRQEPNVN
jgi:hypothetical protein